MGSEDERRAGSDDGGRKGEVESRCLEALGLGLVFLSHFRIYSSPRADGFCKLGCIASGFSWN